jgi:hypothetical protein
VGCLARRVARIALLATLFMAGASRADVDGSMDAAARALVETGEASLAQGATAEAQSAFERAGADRHDAEIEVRLIRALMQAGQYRSAMALAAHSAGIHRDYPDAAALHGWLLFVGGQREVAARLLDPSLAASPGRSPVHAVRLLVAEDWPAPDAVLLDPPLRLAPYSVPVVPESDILSSATLIDGGRRALAPLAEGDDGMLEPGARVRVRNGMGAAVAATIERPLQIDDVRLVVLRLDAALPWPEDLAFAARRPFAGSPGYSVQYVPGTGPARPAWPLLSVGFIGRQAGHESLPSLGIAAPAGALGGPVFDSAGRFAGMAARTADSARFVPLDALEQAADTGLATRTATGAAPRLALDTVYEHSLHLCLQVLLERPDASP